MNDLNEIRAEIDGIDAELAALIERRFEISLQVARYKLAHGMPVLDAAREQAVIARAEGRLQNPDFRPQMRRFFEDIMAVSRGLQHDLLREAQAQPEAAPVAGGVAYLGPEGSFSHEAALGHFGAGAELQPMAAFDAVLDAVLQGRCRFGLLPVENSLTGGVLPAADMLTAEGISIVGETVLPVRHCLLGKPGTTVEEIRAVISHPQPLDQCRRYLRRQGYDTNPRASTAEAAREVAASSDSFVGAIASEQAARICGLAVLERDIQDDGANFTRFAVIARRGDEPAGDRDKISAVFVVKHSPGALCTTLNAFSSRGVNILSLVSRPIQGEPWHYSFHMDFEGCLEDERVVQALREAEGSCHSIRILGNYRRWRG